MALALRVLMVKGASKKGSNDPNVANEGRLKANNNEPTLTEWPAWMV